MSIASLDLNLLVVLHTVLAERSVARASERLHVTPSAISNALARLRQALGDPLVARKGRGIVPTPRALELAPILAATFRDLEAALASARFDPATCTRSFTVALADAGQLAWLPAIAATVAKEMPKAHVRAIGIESLVSLGDLGSPEVDLHIGVGAKLAGVRVEPLFEEPTTLVSRKRHPASKKRLSMRALGELSHVGVEMVPGKAARDPVTEAYARAGIAREIKMTVPSFVAAAAVAAKTDLVATLPRSLVAVLGAPLGLVELSMATGPGAELLGRTVRIAMCWHERTHADPAHIAFRALVRRTLGPGSQGSPHHHLR